jgi:hypothetical protein
MIMSQRSSIAHYNEALARADAHYDSALNKDWSQNDASGAGATPNDANSHSDVNITSNTNCVQARALGQAMRRAAPAPNFHEFEVDSDGGIMHSGQGASSEANLRTVTTSSDDEADDEEPLRSVFNQK